MNPTYSNASLSNNIIWTDSSGIGVDYYTSTTTTGNSITPVTLDLKVCRNCNHAHIESQSGCIEQKGFSIVFVICSCKEYVPIDNLEYLEYLLKKKEDL